MIFFLAIFVLFALVSTVLKFTLIEGRKGPWMALAFVFACCLISYPFAIHQNNQSWLTLLQDRRIVSIVSVIQILEAALTVLLSIHLVKGHFTRNSRMATRAFALVPSPILLGGLFFAQVYAFVQISGISFVWIALAFATATAALILASVRIIKKLVREWALRAEIKIMMAFIQVILAMFLPIIVNEVRVPFTNLYLDQTSMVICMTIVTVFAGLGFIKQRFFPALFSTLKHRLP